MRILVAGFLLLQGCGDDRPHAGTVCAPWAARSACETGDDWECTRTELFNGQGELKSLASVLTSQPGDLDAFLMDFFPATSAKEFTDELPAAPGELVYHLPGFEPYVFHFPVDWHADPFANNTWRMYFQSLGFPYFRGPVGDLELGTALLVQWRDRAMYAQPPPDYTWGDHALAMRLAYVSSLAARYVAEKQELSRTVLRAAAEIILTHLYALSAEACYTHAHNHGMMQDIALLTHVRDYPALRDGERMWHRAQRRALLQAESSVTSDGLHVENTSAYHALFVSLLNSTMRAHINGGAPVPDEFVRIRDSMLVPLVHQIQPDLTFPQFGDANDHDLLPTVNALWEAALSLGVSASAAVSTLQWVATGGKEGAPPPSTDQVFEVGGYAGFRTEWSFDTDNAATVHFKTGHLSRGHYRPDETAFEIFAHGTALILQPGLYSYDVRDPFFAYQGSSAAQNVLVVDNANVYSAAATDRSRVTAHGGADNVVWVQGTHENFRRLGVRSLVRTVLWAKPEALVIVDHVRAPRRHNYAQHFHLHPALSQVEQPDDHTLVATTAGRGPTLAITAAFSPTRVETHRGVAEGNVRKGWHFPAFRTAVPAYDVVFRKSGSNVDLALVILVAAPGKAPALPGAVSCGGEDGTFTVSWQQDGASRYVEFPSP